LFQCRNVVNIFLLHCNMAGLRGLWATEKPVPGGFQDGTAQNASGARDAAVEACDLA
jgi:hypothetical protein